MHIGRFALPTLLSCSLLGAPAAWAQSPDANLESPPSDGAPSPDGVAAPEEAPAAELDADRAGDDTDADLDDEDADDVDSPWLKDRAAPAPTVAPDEDLPVAQPEPVAPAAPASPDEPAPTAGPAPRAEPEAAPAKQDDKQGNSAGAAALGIFGGGKKWPFRGTQLRFRTMVAMRSLLPALDLTYNPMVLSTVAVQPRIWFGDVINFSGYVDVSREWTQSDTTTYEGELQLSDMFLSGAATNFWTVPLLGLNLSTWGTAMLPTSKISWGQTMLARFNLSGMVLRSFPVLGGLTFGYILQGGKWFHRYTTGENETSVEDGRCFSTDVCGIYASSGVRNPEWFVTNRAFVSFAPLSWIVGSLDASVSNIRLYPHKTDPRISFFPEDQTGRFGVQNWRHLVRTVGEVAITPHPVVTFFVGVDTFHNVLDTSGSYRIPAFNRFSMIYADVGFNMSGVASLLFD